MAKRLICVLLCAVLCLSFASCQKSDAYVEKIFFAMDASLTLRIYDQSAREAEPHFAAMLALLREIESALSRTDPESDVAKINRAGRAGDLSPHTLAVLTLAGEVSAATEGAYLATMGAISDLWHAAGENDVLPDEETLAAALVAARAGFALEDGVCTLLGEGALLDLGGVGKGYAIDRLADYCREAGLTALLSFGSSVVSVGEKKSGDAFVISLRHPRDGARTFGTLTAISGALSVSGDYERYVTVGGKRYHHILDPANGYPAESDLASVSVVAPNGALADALSTAFLVMGKEKTEAYLLRTTEPIEAVFFTVDGEIVATRGLDGIFTQK